MNRAIAALCAVMGLGCASTVAASAGDASDDTDASAVDAVDEVDVVDVVDAVVVVDVPVTPDVPVTDNCFDGVITLATEPGSRALMATTRANTFVTWFPEGQPERWAVDAVTVSVDERAPRTIVAWTASGVGDDGRREGAVYLACTRE